MILLRDMLMTVFCMYTFSFRVHLSLIILQRSGRNSLQQWIRLKPYMHHNVFRLSVRFSFLTTQCQVLFPTAHKAGKSSGLTLMGSNRAMPDTLKLKVHLFIWRSYRNHFIQIFLVLSVLLLFLIMCQVEEFGYPLLCVIFESHALANFQVQDRLSNYLSQQRTIFFLPDGLYLPFL